MDGQLLPYFHTEYGVSAWLSGRTSAHWEPKHAPCYVAELLTGMHLDADCSGPDFEFGLTEEDAA